MPGRADYVHFLADLLATINGVPFRLRLERVARDRRHLPQERYSVSGKGRAAILDAPWAPQMQFGNPLADYTAQQLAVNALTINGVVTRSSGKRTVWINGTAHDDGTQPDGIAIGTPESDNRAAPMDVIPSESTERLKVVKSWPPSK